MKKGTAAAGVQRLVVTVREARVHGGEARPEAVPVEGDGEDAVAGMPVLTGVSGQRTGRRRARHDAAGKTAAGSWIGGQDDESRLATVPRCRDIANSPAS